MSVNTSTETRAPKHERQPVTDMRTLVFAPYGREAALVCGALSADGLDCTPCHSADDLERELARGAGAVLLTEEALGPATLGVLETFLNAQPTWSDLPLLLFVANAGDSPPVLTGPLRQRSVTVLERPIRSATLLTLIHTALRSRRRQYELRDLLTGLDARVAARTAELKTANLGLQREISERAAAEAQRFASEARFAKVFEASPLPITVSTLAEGRFIDVNRAALELLGFSRDEFIGRTAAELGQWQHEAPGARRDLLARLEAGGSLRDVDIKFHTKAGDLRDGLAAYEIIELGDEFCLLSMFVDITERKRTEAQLKQAIEKAMQNAAWFSHQVMAELAQLKSGGIDDRAVTELTPRERQVLERIAAGKTNDEISAELGLAEQTVRNYTTNIYGKLNLHSRAEAVVWARERGLVGL